MLSFKPSIVSFFILMIFSVGSHAQALISTTAATVTAASFELDEAKKSAIYERLQASRPDLSFTDLEESPMMGVYQIRINGQLAFVSGDGQHLIAGEMFEVQESGLVNLQELERKKAEIAFAPTRAKLMAAIPKDDMIIYSPDGEPKGHVYIFTDIDCGFCRKLHSEMDQYLAKGIEIRYLAFPRAGVNSMSAKKLETAWCAEDPLATLTDLKKGKNVDIQSCNKNPIADQYMLGQQVGVNATPAIVLESGMIVMGYRPAANLAEEMGI